MATTPYQEQAQDIGGLSWRWLPTLFGGLALFIIFTLVMMFTGNPNLYPTVILIGNGLIPVVFVSFLYQHQHVSRITGSMLARALLIGGLLGILGASLAEPLLVHPSSDPQQGLTLSSAIVVGLVEEGCKALALLWIARRVRHDSELDGLLLGAAVGMGFAALESTGYAFTVFLTSQGEIGASLVETIARGLLAPFGHGVWTGILGAMLFRQSSAARFHFNLPVLFTYLYVSVLHGLWDGLPRVMYIVLPLGFAVSIASIVINIVGLLSLILLFRNALARPLRTETA